MIACYVEDNGVKLNVEQLQVYEEVFQSANNEEARIFSVCSSGYTGTWGKKS